jgi:hypothetical protein
MNDRAEVRHRSATMRTRREPEERPSPLILPISDPMVSDEAFDGQEPFALNGSDMAD